MVLMIETNLSDPIKTFLVGIQEADAADAKASLVELEALAANLDWQSCGQIMVKIRQYTADLFFGRGKADEVCQLATEAGAELIVFDTELSPTHQRNWEELSGLPVTDRPGLIIGIFAERAQTHDAQLQVELARLRYELPRLASSYTNLSRQRGGAYGNKGSGETKIELDRRVIKDRIALLNNELEQVESQRAVLRKQRQTQKIPVVALVGYTNAGKSSLHHALTGSNVYIKDSLFATLDPTARKMSLPDAPDCVLVDTVGFIRKLPHSLIDAFKATLEETMSADLVVNVIDASDNEAARQHSTTLKVLGELGADTLPRLTVLNKCDLLTGQGAAAQEDRLSFGIELTQLRVSAHSGQGLEALLLAIAAKLQESSLSYTFTVPWDRGDMRALIHREARIISSEESQTGTVFCAQMEASLSNRLTKMGIELIHTAQNNADIVY